MLKWIALAVVLISLPAGAIAAAVTVKGSDTLVILVQRWAEEYMKKNPSAKIQVTGGGSGVGLAALINGTTEIATASRSIKDAERAQLKAKSGEQASEIVVAKDGVAFYVNARNAVGTLTLEQLRGIYLGDITNWKEVGGQDAPIVLYSRENSSGTYSFVKEELLKDGDYAANAQTLPGTAAVVNAVSKEANGIGYGGAAYAKGVKELKIKVGNDAIAPSAADVKSGKYPLSRPLFFYVRGAAKADAQAFIDYCLSVPGQQLVEKVGYYPLK
jgi:phosphate transport system substrate-binding protein